MVEKIVLLAERVAQPTLFLYPEDDSGAVEMTPNGLDEELFRELEPVVSGMGFDLVELKSITTKSNTRVFAVIYRRDGLDLEACGTVLKTIRPRIQALVENPDAAVEVSSPGIERVIKSNREYGIFLHRGMKVLVNGESDWCGGVLTKVNEKELEITSKKMKRIIEIASIKKAKLDDGQEVE